MGIKVIADNRKARFNYEIIEKIEVGLVLQGSEVKSLREGKANLGDGFVKFNAAGGELCSVHISPYKNGGYSNHEPMRNRKILLHKHELRRWIGKIKERGLTAVPLKLYFDKNGRVKAELALAKGKKVHDKRDSLKKKAIDRDTRQELKNRRGVS